MKYEIVYNDTEMKVVDHFIHIFAPHGRVTNRHPACIMRDGRF